MDYTHDQLQQMRAEVIHQQLAIARAEFGQARLKLGLFLEAIKAEGLWKGRAESFVDYVDDLGINRKGAVQFMRVARALIVEAELSDAELTALSAVSMSVLELAAQVLSPENKQTVIDLVTSLHARDAKAALELMAQTNNTELGREQTTQKLPAAMRRALNAFDDMPEDQRIDFLNRMRVTPQRPQPHRHR